MDELFRHHRVKIAGMRQHFMRLQTYDPTGVGRKRCWRSTPAGCQPQALCALGIEYFRSHKLDAEHNHEHVKTKLPMPVLAMGGTASFEANLEPEIRPLAENLRGVMMEECGYDLAEEQSGRVINELLCFSAKRRRQEYDNRHKGWGWGSSCQRRARLGERVARSRRPEVGGIRAGGGGHR